MIVLVRLGMHHDRIVHAGFVHQLEQMLRRGRLLGPIGSPLVIGEPRILAAGKAVKMRVDDRDLRTVWWVDVDGTRHPLTWVGIQGDMPAFAKRHLKALRARGGNLERHDPQDLVLILLTQVLPLPDETGWATREGRTATADASRHNRELELVATDRSKGTRTNTQASNQGPTPTPTSPALIDIDRDPATGDHSPAATDLDIADPDVSTTSPTAAELREQQIVAARRAQRMASGADTATDAAPRLGAGRAGLLGDITGDTTEEAGGAA